MLKMADSGEVAALSAFLNKITPQNMRLHLNANNVTLTDAMTVGSFTEASFPGYASVVLDGALWQITPGAPAVAAYPVVFFTCTGAVSPQTIYGYYITRDGAGDLMWAEALPTPQIITAAGNGLTVAPRLTAKDESD